jgi:hypothetical protein
LGFYENDGKSDHPVVNIICIGAVIGALCCFGFKHKDDDLDRLVTLRSGDILLFGGPCRLPHQARCLGDSLGRLSYLHEIFTGPAHFCLSRLSRSSFRILFPNIVVSIPSFLRLMLCCLTSVMLAGCLWMPLSWLMYILTGFSLGRFFHYSSVVWHSYLLEL